MNFITYQSHKYGLQIQYPDNWNKTEKDITESDSTIVSFYSPNAAEVIVTIAVTLEPKDMALDTFVQQHIKNLRDNYSDFKILQSKNARWNQRYVQIHDLNFKQQQPKQQR
jgi:hypothetical protein